MILYCMSYVMDERSIIYKIIVFSFYMFIWLLQEW